MLNKQEKQIVNTVNFEVLSNIYFELNKLKTNPLANSLIEKLQKEIEKAQNMLGDLNTVNKVNH